MLPYDLELMVAACLDARTLLMRSGVCTGVRRALMQNPGVAWKVVVAEMRLKLSDCMHLTDFPHWMNRPVALAFFDHWDMPFEHFRACAQLLFDAQHQVRMIRCATRDEYIFCLYHCPPLMNWSFCDYLYLKNTFGQVEYRAIGDPNWGWWCSKDETAGFHIFA